MLLTVRVDAHGVAVVLATRKPELEFTRKKIWDREPFGWAMLDGLGEISAEGGFNPGELDLDPGHFGQVGWVEGDMLVPTATHINVKVPDLAEFATIEFSRREFSVSRPFGTTRAAAFTVR